MMVAALFECGRHDYGTAIIGLGGAVIGGVLTGVVGPCLKRWFAAKRDKPRKDLLRELLESERFGWRNLSTLMHVIGANEETTKRLLLEIGARGSEDKQELWGLIKDHPFRKQ